MKMPLLTYKNGSFISFNLMQERGMETMHKPEPTDSRLIGNIIYLV